MLYTYNLHRNFGRSPTIEKFNPPSNFSQFEHWLHLVLRFYCYHWYRQLYMFLSTSKSLIFVLTSEPLHEVSHLTPCGGLSSEETSTVYHILHIALSLSIA